MRFLDRFGVLAAADREDYPQGEWEEFCFS